MGLPLSHIAQVKDPVHCPGITIHQVSLGITRYQQSVSLSFTFFHFLRDSDLSDRSRCEPGRGSEHNGEEDQHRPHHICPPTESSAPNFLFDSLKVFFFFFCQCAGASAMEEAVCSFYMLYSLASSLDWLLFSWWCDARNWRCWRTTPPSLYPSISHQRLPALAPQQI